MRKTTPSSAPSHPPPPDPDNYPHLHLGNLREPNASEKPFYRLPKPERATTHSGLVAKPHYLSISLADNPDLLTYLHRSSLTVSQRAEYHRRLRSTTNQRPSCGSPDHTRQPPQQHIQPLWSIRMTLTLSQLILTLSQLTLTFSQHHLTRFPHPQLISDIPSATGYPSWGGVKD